MTQVPGKKAQLPGTRSNPAELHEALSPAKTKNDYTRQSSSAQLRTSQSPCCELRANNGEGEFCDGHLFQDLGCCLVWFGVCTL